MIAVNDGLPKFPHACLLACLLAFHVPTPPSPRSNKSNHTPPHSSRPHAAVQQSSGPADLGPATLTPPNESLPCPRCPRRPSLVASPGPRAALNPSRPWPWIPKASRRLRRLQLRRQTRPHKTTSCATSLGSARAIAAARRSGRGGRASLLSPRIVTMNLPVRQRQASSISSRAPVSAIPASIAKHC